MPSPLPVRRHTHPSGQVFPHLSNVGSQLGALGQDRGIYIAYPVACLEQHLHHGIQQLQTVRAGIGRVGVGKRLSDIP